MSMEGAPWISWEIVVSGAGNVLTVRGLAGSAGFLENFYPAYLNKKPVLDKYVEMSKNDLEGFAVTTITLCHCPKSATQRLLLVWLCEWQQQWLKPWQCLPTLQYLSQYPMLWFYTRGLLHITPVQWEPRTPLPSTNTAHLRYVWHSSYTLERKEEVLLCLRSLPLPATRVSLTQICLTLLFKDPVTDLWFTRETDKTLCGVHLRIKNPKQVWSCSGTLSLVISGLAGLHNCTRVSVTFAIGFTWKKKENKQRLGEKVER